MAHIVLTEDQMRAIGVGGPVDLRGPDGQLVAVAQPLVPGEAEALERLRRRRADPSPEPGIPSAQVQTHMRKLDEIRLREGGMTRDRMLDLLRRMRAGEEV